SVREDPYKMSLATYRELRPAYGFDEVAIVPGSITVNPELTDIQFSIGEHAFNFPILAAALDAVVDARFAIELGRRGGLAVMNLGGLQCRYEEPAEALAEIGAGNERESAAVMKGAHQ